MKQIKKLSLSNVISKLSRNEMRYVMAGSGNRTCISTPACASGCSDGWYCSNCTSCGTYTGTI